MRIQEMRSGQAYLRRLIDSQRGSNDGAGWESDVLEEVFREVFPESEFELEFPEAASEALNTSSDLDSPTWSLVSFHGVEAGGMTYHQAARLIDALGNNGVHGLAIITDSAAARIHPHNS